MPNLVSLAFIITEICVFTQTFEYIGRPGSTNNPDPVGLATPSFAFYIHLPKVSTPFSNHIQWSKGMLIYFYC